MKYHIPLSGRQESVTYIPQYQYYCALNHIQTIQYALPILKVLMGSKLKKKKKKTNTHSNL